MWQLGVSQTLLESSLHRRHHPIICGLKIYILILEHSLFIFNLSTNSLMIIFIILSLPLCLPYLPSIPLSHNFVFSIFCKPIKFVLPVYLQVCGHLLEYSQPTRRDSIKENLPFLSWQLSIFNSFLAKDGTLLCLHLLSILRILSNLTFPKPCACCHNFLEIICPTAL